MLEETENNPDQLDTLESKPSWGGVREGGGRPLGSKNKSTKERQIIEATFQSRILTGIHELLNAQMNIARGASYLYRIDDIGEGKEKRREHILVTDPEEIKKFLDEMEGVEAGLVEETYYYITTKAPDNRALDSLMDRVFGKAIQRQDIMSGGKSFAPDVTEKAKVASAIAVVLAGK